MKDLVQFHDICKVYKTVQKKYDGLDRVPFHQLLWADKYSGNLQAIHETLARLKYPWAVSTLRN